MTHLIRSTFILLFVFSFIAISAQESYFISASGSFVKDEGKAVIKLTVEENDDQALELYYAERDGKKWIGHKFLQKAIQLSDSSVQVSNSRKMSAPFTRIILSGEGDSKLIKQINTDGELEFISEALNVFPLERHGKTTLYDLQGLPMLEEYYLLGNKTTQALLFNPVDSNTVITKAPEFPGGRIEFITTIARRIRYPIHDMKNGNGGAAFVKFKIDENGKMCEVQAAIKPSNSLVKELLRVIKQIKEDWQAAEFNGKKIPVWYYAMVNFQSPGF